MAIFIQKFKFEATTRCGTQSSLSEKLCWNIQFSIIILCNRWISNEIFRFVGLGCGLTVGYDSLLSNGRNTNSVQTLKHFPKVFCSHQGLHRDDSSKDEMDEVLKKDQDERTEFLKYRDHHLPANGFATKMTSNGCFVNGLGHKVMVI